MRSLRLLAWFVTFAIVLHTAASLMSAVERHGWIAWALRRQETDGPLAMPVSNAALRLIGSTTFATAAVLWCVWQWNAAANVRDRDGAIAYPPAWGVAAWFVPFANLWIPYKAVREIWDASAALGERGPEPRWTLRAWWALWLAQPVWLGLAPGMRSMTQSLHQTVAIVVTANALSAAHSALLAMFAIGIVWRITARQESWPDVDFDAIGAA